MGVAVRRRPLRRVQLLLLRLLRPRFRGARTGAAASSGRGGSIERLLGTVQSDDGVVCRFGSILARHVLDVVLRF